MAYDPLTMQFMPYDLQTATAPAVTPSYLSQGTNYGNMYDPSTAVPIQNMPSRSGGGNPVMWNDVAAPVAGAGAAISGLFASNPVTLPLSIAALGLQAFGMFESDRKAKRQRKREQAQQAEYQKQLAWQNLIRVAQGGSPQTAGYQPAPSGGDTGQTLQTLGGALGNFTTNLYSMEQNRTAQKQNEEQMALKQREQSAEEAWRQKQSEDAWKIEQFRQQEETKRAGLREAALSERAKQLQEAYMDRKMTPGASDITRILTDDDTSMYFPQAGAQPQMGKQDQIKALEEALRQLRGYSGTNPQIRYNDPLAGYPEIR